MTWLWARRRTEPADEVAKRLDTVATDLEDATRELRSLVAGLRVFGNIDPSEDEQRGR